MEIAMINDMIVPINQAQISAHDRGIYFGDGVYEAIRFCNGSLFARSEHMVRLENSLRDMDMLHRVDLVQIGRRIDRALAEANIPEALVYFHITRGSYVRNHDYQDDFEPNFFLTIRPHKDRAHTAKVMTYPDIRWKRCHIKSLNLLANVMARHAATHAKCDDAIFVTDDDLVTESTSSTVFMIKDHQLWTTPLSANILPGITRSYLIKLAPQLGLAVREESFTKEQMLQADELFLSGTSTEVTNIVEVDRHPIIPASGHTPLASQLRVLLRQEMGYPQ